MSVVELSRLLAEKRVIVVCGAGGVGKTTTSASLALAAARGGRRVLVITIDPSKRLAQTLGVSPHDPEPRALPLERQRAVGIEGPGSLTAWMLDPQAVSDRTVRSLATDPAKADLLLQNRVYRHVTSMVAGMQEYTAVEALHRFIEDDHYDLVLLDTPPSRNALRFLDAPSRATAFLDRRVIRLFVPGSHNPIRQVATKMFERLLDLAFGSAARAELQQFIVLFEQVLVYLNRNQTEMQRFFASSDVAFLLVSTPRQEALDEAFYFEEKTRDLSLPLAGYILNRSRAWAANRPMPSEELLPKDASAVARRALTKLVELAGPEAESARQHEGLREELAVRAGEGFALALPELPSGASELESLVVLADRLAAPDT
ncbi:MAG: ArsA family ATPase [Deltaproteobacteria bacterium]|nr:ArsA family ATPase [Deltaproteobacteria bacterium]MBW2417841.1 ArsA family ATPase [Deltaproteobacteria bacterium]